MLSVLLSNYIGGPQLRVLSVAKELRKYGIETVMLSPNGDGDFAHKAKSEKFKAYQIALPGPQRFFLLNFKSIFLFFISIYKIAKIINKEKIDIVHVNGLLSFHAPIAALVMRRKVVWHLIGSIYSETLVMLLMPFIWMMADQVVFIAENLKNYYIGNQIVKHDNVHIIYECVDVNKFRPNAISKDKIEKLKKEFHLHSGNKIVGCIGNINPAKGYEYFIESAYLIKKSIPNIKFIIVGDIFDIEKNKYYKKLNDMISSYGMTEDIVFTGQRDNVDEIICLFDLFLLTSIAEGTPLVILEAMAMEKIVVATNVGGISEQIINHKTGILVPSKNPKKIADVVIYLSNNIEESIIMGKEARKWTEAMFSLKNCVGAHKKIYYLCYQSNER